MPGWRYNSVGGCTSCGCTPPGGGGPGNYSGCACQGTPASVSVVATFPPGESSATYHNSVQDSVVSWRTSAPSYMGPSDFGTLGGTGYYSDTSWTNDFGQECIYRLSCVGSRYSITTAFKTFSSWSPGGEFYAWSIGGANTCIPFALLSGAPGTGVIFNGSMAASG